ncbi:MAG: choice-of-anchor I family protein [Cyclobacteriaceae bacterium]
MNKFLRITILFFFILTVINHEIWGQAVSLSSSPYTQDFNSLSNTPDNSTASALPTGWVFLETSTNANTTYRVHNGSGNTGDTYSFGASSNIERAFGQLRSGSLVSTIGGNFQNNTGAAISSITITYIGEQWRLGATGRNDKMDFQYSLDATSLATGAWADVDQLDFTAPISTGSTGALDGNSVANRISLGFTITGLNIANASTFWIRWNDIDATSTDDGLAIDDFQLSFSTGDVTPPTFTSTYPKTSNLSSSGFELLTNLNEIGKTYLVILPNNAAAPTSAQVKSGQDATGASLATNLIATIDVTVSNFEYFSSVSGLADNTDYDVYAVAEDLIPNIQATPTKIDVKTNTAGDVTPPTFTATYPIVNTISATTFTVRTNLDEAGKTYFVVLPSGASAPSGAQVKAAQDASGTTVAVNLAGTINVASASAEFTSAVSGLNPATGYDVYIVAEDNVPNLQASPTKISVTTGTQYVENFNSCNGTGSFVQYSVTGTQVWGCTSFGRNSSSGVQMNGFSGTGVINEDWLISPSVTLSSNPSLSFYSQFSFVGPTLQLKVSTNYSGSGDPSAATWTDLNGNFPTVASTSLFTLSNVDLSAYASQNVYVAFVYTSGAGSNVAARWTLDDIAFSNASAKYLQVSPISLSFTPSSSVKSYVLGGSNLTSDVTITAPANFEVSKDNTSFSSSITYTAVEANVQPTVYVRFPVADPGVTVYSGSITNVSSGVTSRNVAVRGGADKSQTLDIVTYNLEFFGTDVKNTSGVEFGPIDDALQVSNVTTVMQTIAADIFAVQEVADDNAFNQLLTNLPGYNGILSNRWSYSFNAPSPNFPPQKIGFIYNSSTVQVVSSRVMFEKLYDDVRGGNPSLLPGYPTTPDNGIPTTPDNFWSSGRLPFMVTFDVTINGFKKRIRAVVIHAKSGSAQADYDRRKYDVQVLRDSLVTNYANDNIILVGDYNDDVDVSIASPTNPESTYKSFVDDVTNFNTLTYTISQAGAFSFPNLNSFLDHFVTSNELANPYVTNSILVEDPRAYIASYTTTTSDHLPVSARFVMSVKTDQTITFNALPAKTYGNAAFNLTAISTSGLPITYTSSDPTIASISGNAVTILKAGTVTITASQAGDNSYNAAENVDQSLLINPLLVNLSVSANAGTEAGTTAITVTATSAATVTSNQTVDVAVSGTGVTTGDYSLSNTTITIPSGATTGSVTFTIVNDATIEACTETATLTISNPSGGLALGTTTTQAIAITDDDNKVNLTLSAPIPGVTGSVSYEATTSPAVLPITVTATTSAAVTGNQTVDLVVGGTGVTSADYTLSFSTITILNGATTGTATFTVANDTDLEGTEYPTITLANPSSCLTLGATIKRDLVIFDNDFTAAPTANNEIQLTFLSSYLNVGPSPGNSAEISAYDATSKRLFIVNSLGKKLNIVDFSNPAAMSNVATIDISVYGGINSVAVRNGIVATAIEGGPTTGNPTGASTDNGSVIFFDKDGTLLKQVAVGAMPDMITFSPNGNFVLTANEGEPNDAYTIDPEGTVSVIDISGGVANLTQANVTTVNFNAFDSQLATLRTQGVRIYGLNATVSKDLEPEYIAFSSDGNTAYVTLQENNAIGVLDMATKTITAIRPLGLKDHSLLKNGLDASDQNGVPISISNLPVKGMYQPDAIAGFAVGGTSYLITANEGDSRAYAGLNEEIRVGATGYVLDPTVFPNAALLKTNSVLGRLQLTNRTGDTDGDGDFDEIHALGARSFSIWKPTAAGLEQVFDSGDQMERITAADAKYASIFNASNDNASPALKNRSDNKGPEPEGVTVTTIDGKIYVFIALERIGGVMAYNITDPANPVFVQWANSRNLTAPFGDLGAEGIFFISAKDSPTGVPLVVLSNEISSTISVYSIGGGTLPSAPTSLKVTASTSQVAATLAWTDNATNETGFEIQRSLNSSSGFAAIGTVSSNTTTYVDNTVSVGTTYFYKVRAFNDFGFSTESNTESVTITKVDQTITFNALPAKNFGDASFTLSATSTSGLPVSFISSDATIASISGNTVTILKVGTVNITASQVGDASFNAATSVVQPLTINKANQTTTFSALPAKTFGDAAFALSATSSSSLPVSFSSSDATVASITGNTVTILKAGTVNITASQAGDASFNAATNVVQPLTINKANQTITFSALANKTFGDAAFALSATSTSGLPVSFSSSDVTIASISGNTVNILKAGTVNITASQIGDASFNAAADVVQSLTISKANQVITFTAIPDKLLGDAPFTFTLPTSTSGLTVTVTPNAKVTVNGNQTTLVSAGKASITASQSGNGNYNAATSVIREFCIKPAKPSVTVSLVGSTATLTSSAVSGNQWFLNNVAIPSATNSTYAATTAGTYKVQVTIDNCVSDFSVDTPVVITGDLQIISSITAYPNPADDRLMIVGLEEETRECIVVDLLGRNTILSLTKQKGGHEASVESFSSGVYLVRVQQSNSIQQIRFVKR